MLRVHSIHPFWSHFQACMCYHTIFTEVERERQRGRVGKNLLEGPRSERHEAQRWLKFCTSFRGRLPDDDRGQRLS